jgi:hypothetical protein
LVAASEVYFFEETHLPETAPEYEVGRGLKPPLRSPSTKLEKYQKSCRPTAWVKGLTLAENMRLDVGKPTGGVVFCTSFFALDTYQD